MKSVGQSQVEYGVGPKLRSCPFLRTCVPDLFLGPQASIPLKAPGDLNQNSPVSTAAFGAGSHQKPGDTVARSQQPADANSAAASRPGLCPAW